MENNTKIAIGLAAAVVVGYIVYNKSKKPKAPVTPASNSEALYTTSINVADLVCDKNRVGDVSKNCINEKTQLQYEYMPALDFFGLKQPAFYTLEKDGRVYTYDVNGKFLNADYKHRACELFPEGCDDNKNVKSPAELAMIAAQREKTAKEYGYLTMEQIGY